MNTLAILVFLLAQTSEKQILRNHLNTAEAVFTGTVVEIKKAPGIMNPLELSFNNDHNARWRWAVIDVDENFLPKGVEYLRLQIIFPLSENGNWKNVPKFEVGDAGVFIANSVNLISSEKERRKFLMVLERIDFQPKERFPELRKLYINYPPR